VIGPNHEKALATGLAATLGAALLAGLGCAGNSGGQTAPHTVHGCSPLAANQCVTPFPNAWFEEADSTTATGIHVTFPSGTLPRNSKGVGVEQAAFGTMDGYSPSTEMVAWFPEGVDPGGLTPADRGADSLDPTNPIAVVDLAAEARVPFFSEVDANATGDQRQALLVHPLARLAPNHRYAVAIRNTLHDRSGAPLAAGGDFAAWAAGRLPRSSALAEIADRLDADATVFAKLGIERSSLALAWDFDTASEAQSTRRLLHMRDDVLAAAPRGLGYHVGSAVDPDPTADADAFRIVNGTFQSPSFETGPDPSLLHLGPDEIPIMGDPANWPFTAIIPRCAAAASEPVPLLIVGHGLFDTAESELMADRYLLEDLCMVGIGTDWPGVTTRDELLIGIQVLPDVNRFGLLTERLMQAHANFQVLTRLALNALADDPAFSVGGRRSYDTTHAYYYGASNGGIQGATYLALSPDIERGILNVPGADWNLMMWRSSHFSLALFVLDAFYPDKLDQQLLVALSQSLWDQTDPIEFAPHLADPFPGVPGPKQAVFQESLGDAQVPNVATRVEMRTLGIPGLAPLVEPVFGITEANGPLSGLVYTQWDVKPTPLPPASDVRPDDNQAHEAVRRLPAAIEQMRRFLRPDGQVENTCGGACVYPVSTP